MKLARIAVENYRSIDERIEFDLKKVDKSCYFLFGINETGKSNILKACALLDGEHQGKYNWIKDCYKENRRANKATKIDYYFDFDSEELKTVSDILQPYIPREIIEQINGVWYWVEGDKDSKIQKGFRLIVKDDSILDGYSEMKIPNPPAELPTQENVTAEDKNIENKINAPFLVKNSKIEEAEKESYQEVDSYKVAEIISKVIDEQFINQRLPAVIFWDSSSMYLINGPIDLNTFKVEPTKISVPLFNMFKFLKFNKESLNSGITEALQNGTDRHKLAEDLSQTTTKHLNKVWGEHEVEVDITIDSNGSCEVHFADKDASTNFFEAQDRSDGFQRFISFILTISAENINDELKNKLILLDEPEAHLHPSGIEYLKEELLNISKNGNYILAASHSIFLVDRPCLERHITVKKVLGRTSIAYVDPGNPFQEEVIFRALNTSIYELVQPINIIFEGRIDSDIFLATKHKFRSELRSLVSVGGIGATGAPEVKKYEKFFRGNIHVNAIAVFDSDEEGRRELGRVKEESLFKDKAFELGEIYDIGKKEFELEDLLPQSVVLDNARKLYRYDFSGEINGAKSILNEIKRIKHEQNIIDDKNLEKLKESIVKNVLNDTDSKILTKDKFKAKYDIYYKFLEALGGKIASVGK